MTESQLRNQYDRIAKKYDKRWSRYLAKTLSFLKSWTQISPSATVLDIACGTGEFERMLLREHATQTIVGVDISEQMLSQAKYKLSTYPNVSFYLAKASELPFLNNSFDIIICANSFHYFDNPLLALNEMQRVLKPEGKVVILDWCKDYWVCKICDWVLKILDPAHQQCYTQAELHHFLISVNFIPIRATKFGFGLVWGLMAAEATAGEPIK